MAFFWGTQILYPLDKTESLQLDIARTMLAENSPWLPRVSGENYFDKPPLPYWLAWPMFRFLPSAPWLARLGAAFSSTLGVIVTVLCVWRLGGTAGESGKRRWARAVLAGVILACLPGYAAFARVAVHDSYLTSCLVMALTWLYELLFVPTASLAQRWRLALGAGAALGVGFLAKGLLAWLLPAAVLIGYALLTRQGRSFGRQAGLLAVSAALAIALPLPWLLAAYRQAGMAFVAGFLGHSNFGRITSTVDDHAGPWFYYLPVLLVLSFPWGLLAVPTRARWALWLGRIRQREAPHEPATDLQVFALVWLTLTVLLLSLASTKLPHYILGSLPPLAILVAYNVLPEPPAPQAAPLASPPSGANPYARGRSFYRILGVGTAAVLAALALIPGPVLPGVVKLDRVFPEYTQALLRHVQGPGHWLPLLLLAALLLAVVLGSPRRRLALVLAWLLVAMLAWGSIVPSLAGIYREHRQNAILALADRVAEQVPPEVPIYVVGKSYHSVALRTGRPIHRVDSRPELAAHLRAGAGTPAGVAGGTAVTERLVLIAPANRPSFQPEALKKEGLAVLSREHRQGLTYLLVASPPAGERGPGVP
ncbi:MULTISPECIES: ArnT family glycosyltransferase [Aphanothece]|uniref:ArnT family glycosyltransferase n=1 Tax=Aphanothece TaxID=1121 RepID=UPI003984D373